MSRELVESIISNNMLEANDMVEAKLAEIREKKIYEMKRMFAAKMYEGVGGLTKAEIEARKKAGYRKASEVLGDPRKGTTLIPGHKFEKVGKVKSPKRKSIFDIDMSKEKKISEETLDEAGLGDAAKIVHSLSDKEKALFKAGKKGSILSALRFRRAMSQKQAQAAKEAETAQSKTVDAPEEKKDGVIRKAVKSVVGSKLVSDLADIGSRHL